jgi:hypothetical protein
LFALLAGRLAADEAETPVEARAGADR